jgi:hypothetical protein
LSRSLLCKVICIPGGLSRSRLHDHQPAAGRLRIAVRGANHFLFSDDGALLKSHLVMRALGATGLIGIERRRQLAVTAYCVRSFSTRT